MDKYVTPQENAAYAEGIAEAKAVMTDSFLSDAEKKRRVHDMIEKQTLSIKELEAEIAKDELRKAAMEAILEWNKITDFKLERNDCSRLHKLADAIRSGSLVCVRDEDQKHAAKSTTLVEMAQVFVVAHDWASAFGDAIGALDDEFVLPYPHCAFEFRVSGKTIVCVAFQPEGGEIGAAWFVDIGNGQWFFVCDGDVEAFGFVWSQVKAICIALDAEVATHEVVRASVALNKKIERLNRCPVFDYHVVSLSRRHRALPAGNSEPTGQRRRLHFRRGHWRYYEDHKTWIKWMLVGDPSLGFIDKHYSL